MSNNEKRRPSVTNISAWLDNESDIGNEEMSHEMTQTVYEDFKTIDEGLLKVIETPQASDDLADKIKFQCLGRINPEQYTYEPKLKSNDVIPFLSYFSRAAIVLLSAGIVYLIANKQEQTQADQYSHHSSKDTVKDGQTKDTPVMKAVEEPVAEIKTVSLRPVEDLDSKLEKLAKEHKANETKAIVTPQVEVVPTTKFDPVDEITIPAVPKMPNTYKQFWLVDSIGDTISEIHETLPENATFINLDKVNDKVSHITIHLPDDAMMDLLNDVYRKGATLVSDDGPHPLKADKFTANGNYVLYTFQLVEK